MRSTWAFVVGVGVGALVAVATMRQRIKKEFLKKFEELTPEMVEEITRNLNNPETAPTRSGAVEPSDKIRVLPQNRYNRMVRQYGRGSFDPRGTNDSEKEWDEENQYQSHERMSTEDHDTRPHVITVEEFTEGMNHFDKSTINFYEDDATLADENEEVIDIAGTIGHDALQRFGEGSEDPEIVYVRNEKLGIDYEVIRLSKSYGETVLGRDRDD